MLDAAAQAECEIFRSGVRGYLTRHVVPRRDEWRAAGKVSPDAWREAGRAGLLLASIPEHLGGMGGDFRHEVVIMEELAAIGFLDFNLHLHNAVVAPYLHHYGTVEQQRRWFPGLASGELIGAIAMTEPGAGSDLKAIRTKATRDGDEFVISGQKTFISNGQLGNWIIVACKTDASLGSRGISLIAVETDGLSGFRRGRKLDKVGLKAQDTSELFFDDVRVPAENLIGELDGGFKQMMHQLPQERLTIAVQGVAAIKVAVKETLAYVKNRQAFGSSIFDFQNTRFVLADAATEAEVAQVFVDHCIQELLASRLSATKAAMAKLWVTERQTDIIDNCVQLFGGYGYMLEYPIARLWADSRIQRIYGGTSEIMKEVIARSL